MKEQFINPKGPEETAPQVAIRGPYALIESEAALNEARRRATDYSYAWARLGKAISAVIKEHLWREDGDAKFKEYCRKLSLTTTEAKIISEAYKTLLECFPNCLENINKPETSPLPNYTALNIFKDVERDSDLWKKLVEAIFDGATSSELKTIKKAYSASCSEKGENGKEIEELEPPPTIEEILSAIYGELPDPDNYGDESSALRDIESALSAGGSLVSMRKKRLRKAKG